MIPIKESSMNTGKTVFSQIMEFLPLHQFRRCVQRYKGDYKVQSFSCMDQFLCMAFAQLTFRESLRDIEACLRSMQSKLYHMGIRGNISRTTLARASEAYFSVNYNIKTTLTTIKPIHTLLLCQLRLKKLIFPLFFAIIKA